MCQMVWILISSVGPDLGHNFLCSTKLSMESLLLLKTKIPTNDEVYCFKSLRFCIYHANNCWDFNIYEQDKFRAQLS